MSDNDTRRCPHCNRIVIPCELPHGKRVLVTQGLTNEGTRYRKYERGGFVLPVVIRTKSQPGHRLHDEVCNA